MDVVSKTLTRPGAGTGCPGRALPQWEETFSEALMPASTRTRRKVAKVMREYKRGALKSRGRRKVKSRRQAIAIAMSESGQSRRRRKRR